jgi:nitrite reductase (NADH) small subunit
MTKGKHHLGSIDQFPLHRFRIMEIEGRSIGLVNSGDRVHAVRNLCPHQMAPLCRGKVTGTMLPSEPGELCYGLHNQVIRCPWHNWEFRIDTGEAVFETSSRRATTYQVDVEEGQVYIQLSGAAPK